MATIRGMMAVTLDGFVADEAGGVGFLDRFQHADWGWSEFFAQIGTVVMGRKTYEQIWTLAPDWPYADRPGIVLGRPAAPLRGPVTLCPDLETLIARSRAAEGGDVWVVGGPALQAAFIDRGALERLQLCVLPHLLGRGVRLFPDGIAPPGQPVLSGVTALPQGMVMLDYRFGASGLGGRER